MTRKQRKQLENLSYFITSEVIRISHTYKTLNSFNKAMQDLRNKVSKKFDEILSEEEASIAAVLIAVFASVFAGHLLVLTSSLNNATYAVTRSYVEENYWKESLGEHYKRALKNVKSDFMKKFDLDTRIVRRQFLDETFDVKDVYDRYNKYTKQAINHFDFINEQELHRDYETAKYESAKYLDSLGVVTNKTWDTMKDEKVRNKRDVASHVAMQGVTVNGIAKFNLVPNGQTYHPIGSGIPEQDINCRCHSIYKVV